jgi:hypothetical protein
MVTYSETLKSGDVVMDINYTPIKIDDPEEFKKKIQEQHRMIMNEYAQEYKKIVE